MFKRAENDDETLAQVPRLTRKKEEQHNCLSSMRALQSGKEGMVEEHGQMASKLEFGHHKHVTSTHI